MRKLVPLLTVLVVLVALLGCAATSDIDLAVIEGDIQKVKRLVDAGGNVNDALHWVDDKEICEYLINNGADVNSLNVDGETPIYSATEYEIINTLIEHGADINIENNRGETPLNYHVEMCVDVQFCLSAKTLNVLIAAGADINTKDYQGSTPFHKLASGWGLYDNDNEFLEYLFDFLLENGGDLYASNTKGLSPIAVSVIQEDSYGFFERAISKGINLNNVDYSGNTILHNLAKNNLPDKAKYLVSLGADPTIRNNKGQTPDYIFAEQARIAAENTRKEEQQQREEQRRQQQNNDQLTAALFGVAMGVAMDNAGASAGEALQASTAMYQDVANDTTSNMQSLNDQYQQQNSLTQQRQIAENQQFLQDNNQAYENTMEQQQAKTAAYNNCVNNGGMWNNDQCYMPSGSQSQKSHQYTKATISSSTQSNPQQRAYEKQIAEYTQRQKSDCAKQGGFVWDDKNGCVMRAESSSYVASNTSNQSTEPYNQNNTEATWSGQSSNDVDACDEKEYDCICKQDCESIGLNEINHEKDHAVDACQLGCLKAEASNALANNGPVWCTWKDPEIAQICVKETDNEFSDYCVKGYEIYKSYAGCKSDAR